MNRTFTIRIGDKVRYMQNFGNGPAATAKVESIEKCEAGEKYGDEVEEIKSSDSGTVSLSDGRWAYVEQITGKL